MKTYSEFINEDNKFHEDNSVKEKEIVVGFSQIDEHPIYRQKIGDEFIYYKKTLNGIQLINIYDSEYILKDPNMIDKSIKQENKKNQNGRIYPSNEYFKDYIESLKEKEKIEKIEEIEHPKGFYRIYEEEKKKQKKKGFIQKILDLF